MVDFKNRISKKANGKKTNPIEIYDTLDRQSDKGPLRPAQVAILQSWFESFREQRDVTLKLHTGQGKTLIGLLILQSRLNAGDGPCLYLCPDKFLVEQTCKQASEFGIPFCTIDDGLPEDFSDGKAILVTHVHMLFNGLTKFKIGPRSAQVSSIVLDDAHACLDSIRQCFTVSLPQESQPYSDLLQLFGDTLADQGPGTFQDIKGKKSHAFLPVPYWDWHDKSDDVTRILAKYSDQKSVKFAWPLIRDNLKDCLCLVSGTHIEICPYSLPLGLFGSYAKAKQRIYMSATINDDSFFIKGLGVDPTAITNSLRLKNEKWSGEKMMLIPTLIDDSLDRELIVNRLAPPYDGRRFGMVALVPSFEIAGFWGHCGATVAKKETIDSLVAKLKGGEYRATIVFANRYDGIDLPDNACRILILDSKPFAEDLVDKYQEQCRANSDVVHIKLAQRIEQGMGRHIRGEKDYGIVILVGPELIKAVRSKNSRQFFSAQTRSQIEIGLEIAEMAKAELTSKEPWSVLNELIRQCLQRDEDWKGFYVEKMDEIDEGVGDKKIQETLVREKKAEDLFASGNYARAVETLQKLMDDINPSDEDRGWYLQEMARFTHPRSKVESNHLQVSAHRKNPFLLKPKDGMVVEKLSSTGQKRVENIIEWMRQCGNAEDLILKIDEILEGLKFGVDADRFEASFDQLGAALGFRCQRPDRQWKVGPDNLWSFKDGEFLLVECKSEVNSQRVEIYKDETGQMNNACAWFSENYPGCSAVKIIVIPAKQCGDGAGFNHPVRVMRGGKLGLLRSNVRKFFKEFAGSDLSDISEKKVNEAINAHSLNIVDFSATYSEQVKGKVAS
jgi:replicative superfamily II helicase